MFDDNKRYLDKLLKLNIVLIPYQILIEAGNLENCCVLFLNRYKNYSIYLNDVSFLFKIKIQLISTNRHRTFTFY